MGRRGPAPQPSRVREMRGNPSRRPLNASEPKPAAGAPRCPAWLPKVAKAAWKYYVKLLDPIRMLTQADRDALACLCLACWKLETATRQLEKRIAAGQGLTQSGESGYEQPHPLLAMQRAAMEDVKKFASLFGLDPSSRSRLSVPGQEPAADPFETFLQGATGKN
jgi:P27 family predicted phage terminase small subunit